MKEIAEMITWAVAAGVVWLGWLGFECFVWPYGRFRSPTGRAWRSCRKCDGSGSRVRLGRRVWTKLGIAKDKLVG